MTDVLYEILDGKSEIKIGDKIVYFKHPSVFSNLKQEKLIERFKEIGAKNGILPESSLIEEACFNGAWSKEKDEESRLLDWELGKIQTSFSKTKDPSLKKQIEGRIQDIDRQASVLKKERDEITRFSLEKYALIKASFVTCQENLYEDEELSKNIKVGDEGIFVTPYISKIQELSSKENLLHAAYKPEMLNCFFIYQENPQLIFSQNIYQLTIFKRDLLIYGTTLHSKLRNGDIPESVKNDPVKVFDWQKTDKVEQEAESIRSMVNRRGGLDNLTPQDKLT